MLSKTTIQSEISEYFERKFSKFGYTPQGVDWRHESSQHMRLEQVLKVLPNAGNLTLNDVGCGFGSLVDIVGGDSRVDYRGFDLSSQLIDAATRKYGLGPKRQFSAIRDIAEVPRGDYSVASGVFNMKLATPVAVWEQYVLESVQKIAACSQKGFAFNLLTSYSDADKQRDDLYYADPCMYFDFCKKRFSPNVALLHDYGLYDFTVIVRMI